jgi:ubiquinone/menaquinone biosynthesis C-methylase UbiE
MKQVHGKRVKLVPEMEGAMARWYARQRGTASQIEEYRRQAARLTDGLPDGAAVLEVAPGPGYLAIEIARLGRFRVTGLDISATFVQIATENARRAAVSVEFHRGDVASMPFPADSFDLVVCQAAFKNFVRPVIALNEMHRILRAGATAVIADLSGEATRTDIEAEVARMRLTRLNAVMTRSALSMLRRRALSRAQFERAAADSAFRACDMHSDGVGIEVRLTKRAFPELRQVVLDCTDARGLAEFYRHLLGWRYRPGDEPPADDDVEPKGQDWLVLRDAAGNNRLAFQQVAELPKATWPQGPRPQQLHLDLTVATAADLDVQHERVLALGGRPLDDRSQDPEEPLRVYADPAGHPFCIFAA